MCPYAWDRPGGVQTHVRALATELGRRGHDALVLAPGTRPTSQRARDEDRVVLVGRAFPVPANGSVAPIALGPRVAARLRRSLEGFRPDVLHVHEPLIPSLSLIALASRTPSVGTFHAAAERSGGYRLARPLLERAARRLEIRTAVSDAARSLVARYFPGTYHLTPNGVDYERFAGAQPADLGAGPQVLFLGRLERRKGLPILVDAMARLRDLDATLVVAGDGPEAGACRQLAARLGVRARFLGRVSENDKASLFKAADAYCAPGLRGESFGIVLIEAMAAGTPVVCSDLPGFRGVVGTAGYLVAPGDPAALATALRSVLTNHEGQAERLAREGTSIARSYDWSRLVGGVEAMYEKARAGAS